MDIGTLRGLGTLMVLVAMIGVICWAYSGRRKADFDQAALLPFGDDLPSPQDRNDSRSTFE
ncbi:CcoQ/FixQ family Cbb3-type cytochrome c oxidase assembly chaperone [Metapseudomonas otitidis]|jgi:cytochrome c oxidase cbb3-type subunit 4|uniref:CcoQ/FixQ family Cbb3-type cytochrome c oxidase assembly chaperone n=1 Tax=Metapseudomonas otitidis TaxID=319939 RepID=A0A1I0SXC1_9GAMM|nr:MULTISPECIES: CcoQ/FixQ family Cbb3-type cytochrome c oxidase assembly chaperone [Pseudomonas]MDL5600373.1 CcoQ/FixQ family Cbb3-type cytochrome c oxidase assembly chaperone [Bacillus subtilis]KIV74831.1 Cytochrome c oxidase subunit CcoQ [Pseudomonas sp. FeS53a]MBO2929392.1 CcoQ/FixQ family Cbb3-type cytochrome c oxidase assembly chaperone [Pseudomonas otitidis]MCO7554642.1 CcoQ/FixQ family Cbb3-type cytochrome c oxidase assembly chaperone [Pseudomonas otitidis]MCP1615763.1 cytochrome c oxi